MKVLSASVIFCCSLIFVAETSVVAAPIKKDEVDYQNQAFKQWYGTTMIWRFERLPSEGAVGKHRVPYAGCIYPDQSGGTASVLSKYDWAFHRGDTRAEQFEWNDIAVRGAPHWAGHCNGWTAAAIRHAEPKKSVERNGVVFSPAEIKGLLAELYAYSDSEFLGGVDAAINPATLHVIITNWIGRGQHPIGIETSVGREVWNYPAFAFKSNSSRRGPRKVEVKLNLGYVDFLESEVNRAPKKYHHRYFHYMLALNEDGEIVDGTYMHDSDQIDMLWVPLRPTKGGTKGNEDGNPHLDPDVVLAMWRESVDESVRTEWIVVDPLPEDAVVLSDELDESSTGESIAATAAPAENDTADANRARPMTRLPDSIDVAVAVISDENRSDALSADYPATVEPEWSQQGSQANAGPQTNAGPQAIEVPQTVEVPQIIEVLVPARTVAAVRTGEPQEANDDSPPAVVAAVPVEDEPVAEPEIEIFRERFADGIIKVEREVTMDAGFNYVNHGTFREWNEDGVLVTEGRFDSGRRVGSWMRTHAKNASKSLSLKPFTLFEAPFVSESFFRDGRMHGKWTITDSQGRVASQIDFVDGVRHGNQFYYFPNGKKMRDVVFDDGIISGKFHDYDDAGQLIREVEYADGHYHANQVKTFVSTTKKSETGLRYPKMTMTAPDDWWNAELAQYSVGDGEPVRHGSRVIWYESGQERFRGAFDQGKANGDFTWWMENGQVVRKGSYVDGAQVGRWTWWHENGAKSVQGDYGSGKPVGRWLFWNPDGGLAQAKQMSGSDEVISRQELPAIDGDNAGVASEVDSAATEDGPVVSPLSSRIRPTRR